jgi:ATP-binding cassette, subfamily B, bacterial PglK
LLEAYRKLISLLDARERRHGALVFALLVVVAFFEAVGVASVMPFIAALANPEVIETNRYLAAAYERLGFNSRETFLIFLGLAFFGLVLGSLTLKAIGTWAQLRFSHHRNFAWSTRLVGGYLRQPYDWFLRRHSAELGTAVLAEVNQVVAGALFPAMQAIAHLLVAVFLMTLLIVVDPLIALGAGVGLGGGFAFIFMLLRRRLRRLGVERRQANRSRFYVVQEAFGGIKDVKVAGLEEAFVKRFVGPARTLARREVSAGMIAQLPSFIMQALLLAGMLLVLLYLIAVHGGFQQAVPIAALYAFAGYRLMPAVQLIYRDLSQLRFAEAALDSLCQDFSSLHTVPSSRDERTAPRIRLQSHLELRDVSYVYPGSQRAAVHSISLRIAACTTVGIVGSTGSGKTTLVDLILCLLRPSSGALLVDGVEIVDEKVRPWQRSLGYVPQQIFLSDDTVAGNIAFGLPAKEIDAGAVERAARIANLHDFVINELSEGYQTLVGERGVRLSGGQRQRIGIARALYHNPDVLILDEATSALDNITEHAVMEAVHNLGSRKTILMIAHRLSTVRNCDCIFLLEGGELVASGSYDQLVEQDERFRAMAKIV